MEVLPRRFRECAHLRLTILSSICRCVLLILLLMPCLAATKASSAATTNITTWNYLYSGMAGQDDEIQYALTGTWTSANTTGNYILAEVVTLTFMDGTQSQLLNTVTEGTYSSGQTVSQTQYYDGFGYAQENGYTYHAVHVTYHYELDDYVLKNGVKVAIATKTSTEESVY